jgi:diguanylate cyclase (GGDEF)-like protein/PAS domain S-box-containing protein
MPIDIENDSLETALKKLKARENNLKQLENVSKLGSWEIDLITQQSIWSSRSYEIYGIPKESKVELDTFFSLLLPEYREEAQKRLQEAMQTGESSEFICKVKHTSGKILQIALNAQVIYDEQKNPIKLIGSTQDITEQTLIKEHVKELSQLIEHSSNEIYVLSVETLNYLYVNKGACDALGYTKEELLTMNVRDVNPQLTEKDIERHRKNLLSSKKLLTRTVHKCKDNSLYHVQSFLHMLTYQDIPAFAIFDTDITQTVALELQYKKQARILDYIHDSIISTDINGDINNWNNGSKLLFGYEAYEMLGKNILETFDSDNEYSIEQIFSLLKQKGKLDIEAYMFKKDKTRIICDISLSVSRDESGEVDGYIGYIQDITDQKRIKSLLEDQTEQLKYQAHHDTLTDLPNRALFKDRLSQAIAYSKRNNEQFALLFIDLDQFKKINDSLGHDVGDEVLIEAASRLKSVLREGDTLARLGGDEFTIILRNTKSILSASQVAQRVVNIMKETIVINKHNLYVTSSIGISIYPTDSERGDNLIKFADVAMYKAKDEGRNNFQFYSSEMTSSAFERVVMESNLKIALKEDQFVVHYQPQFTTKDKKIVGMEALVRWNHPTLGLIPPGKFIPIAEENGLIIDIDNLVMRKAMTQFRKWYNMNLNPGILSLNLAMKQLEKENYLPELITTMSELSFISKWLELEVTESQVMKNAELSIKKLKQIHNMGIEVAIDDFGTGYSSLSYLKKLPLDKLKIDQSFIRDIPEDEDDMAITKAIIALGKSLNLTIIAEGVETQEQQEFLVENDCDLIQGFFYSRPIPEDEIELLLKIT